MRPSTVTAFLAPAAAKAQWYGGAPECAQSCMSSLWDADSTWPAPTSYCAEPTQAAPLISCISSACSASPTAVTSYSSLSASLCAQWASCSAAGSTGVLTVSAPAFTGAWGSGRGSNAWGGDGEWTKTWAGGVYTVTGCEWNGNPWAGGPGGWGPGGEAGGSPWGPWGKGWKWSTETQTVTRVFTGVDNGVTSFSTSIGLATVALAVSGDSTTTSFLAQATGNAAAEGSKVDSGVRIMGAVLGGVVAVAGLL
ncbi:Putative protein of unknown function [Podospora comata]|nr:Putative protein of unknown function [Podospora comata]